MANEDLMRIAREAGFQVARIEPSGLVLIIPLGHGCAVELKRFAELVALHVREQLIYGSRDEWVLVEREACAKEAEAQGCHMVAASIRARGQG
jgi:hypothetical protein